MALFLFIDRPALVCGWVNFPTVWPHTPVQTKLKWPPLGKSSQGFKLSLLPGCLRFLNYIFYKIMQGITNLTQDVQRTWVGIQRTQITRMCSFWFFASLGSGRNEVIFSSFGVKKFRKFLTFLYCFTSHKQHITIGTEFYCSFNYFSFIVYRKTWNACLTFFILCRLP